MVINSKLPIQRTLEQIVLTGAAHENQQHHQLTYNLLLLPPPLCVGVCPLIVSYLWWVSRGERNDMGLLCSTDNAMQLDLLYINTVTIVAIHDSPKVIAPPLLHSLTAETHCHWRRQRQRIKWEKDSASVSILRLLFSSVPCWISPQSVSTTLNRFLRCKMTFKFNSNDRPLWTCAYHYYLYI